MTPGARLFVALCLAGMVALVAAMYRLGRLVAGVPGGFVAAGLLLTRFNFGLLASKGYLDVPYCALRGVGDGARGRAPRRGGAVWWLLGLAGLLRPEAWLLAGALRALARARRLVSRAAGAAARVRRRPAMWAALDFVVTGDPLFSIQHTDALAAELQREIPLRRDPVHDAVAADGDPQAAAAVLAAVGVVLAVREAACGRSRCPPRWRSSRSRPTS